MIFILGWGVQFLITPDREKWEFGIYSRGNEMHRFLCFWRSNWTICRLLSSDSKWSDLIWLPQGRPGHLLLGSHHMTKMFLCPEFLTSSKTRFAARSHESQSGGVAEPLWRLLPRREQLRLRRHTTSARVLVTTEGLAKTYALTHFRVGDHKIYSLHDSWSLTFLMLFKVSMQGMFEQV